MLKLPCPGCNQCIGHAKDCPTKLPFPGFDRPRNPGILELAEQTYDLLAPHCTAGDAREVLALVANRIQEKEARAAL